MGGSRHPEENIADSGMLLDGIQDGYVEADVKGSITSVNLSFVRALGFNERSEVTGKCIWKFTKRQYERGIALAYSSVIEKSRPSEALQIVYCGTGTCLQHLYEQHLPVQLRFQQSGPPF